MQKEAPMKYAKGMNGLLVAIYFFVAVRKTFRNFFWDEEVLWLKNEKKSPIFWGADKLFKS